LTIIQST